MHHHDQASCACRAFILPLADVINHLFGEPTFARYAGTRTMAMLQCPLYRRLDLAHGCALSALADPKLASGLVAGDQPAGSATDCDAPVQPTEEARGVVSGCSDHVPASPESDDLVDPDPQDDLMTAHGPDMVLLFGLFVDGVQLHGHGRSTTTVFALKCLDLPGFLANTDLASYTIAFIDGPKEPTCMTTVMMTILKQFKIFEPAGVEHAPGAQLSLTAG